MMKNKGKLTLILLLVVCFAVTPVFASEDDSAGQSKIETDNVIEKIVNNWAWLC